MGEKPQKQATSASQITGTPVAHFSIAIFA